MDMAEIGANIRSYKFVEGRIGGNSQWMKKWK